MATQTRPFGVGAITLLLLLLAGALALDARLGRLVLPWQPRLGLPREIVAQALGYAIAALVCAVAVGMWRLKREAWVATMLLVGALMVLELLRYARGAPRYHLMALSVLIVFYLNQHEVQARFRQPAGPA